VRLTEIKLPLDHDEPELRAAILKRLGITDDALHSFSIHKRAVDARRRHAPTLIYTIDVTVADEAALLRKLGNDRHAGPTPDTPYRFVTQAPHGLTLRPVVIGTGPCGLFAGLLLAQMGFRPLILERGKAVRERTQDTWDLWRKKILIISPREEPAVVTVDIQSQPESAGDL